MKWTADYSPLIMEQSVPFQAILAQSATFRGATGRLTRPGSLTTH